MLERLKRDGILMNLANIGCCYPKHLHQPSTTEEVRGVVKAIAQRGGACRCLGGAKSPNCSAFTNDHLISTHLMNRIISIDKDAREVTCEGGVTMEALLETLDNEGLMLRCVPSYLKTTVAGCLATATHSSGKDTWSLCDYVTRMAIVDGTGEVRLFDAAADETRLRLAACHLGVLGVVTEVTLRVEPRALWRLESRPLPLAEAERGDLMLRKAAEHDYYRFWWVPHTTRCYESSGTRLDAGAEAAEAMLAWERKERSLRSRLRRALKGDWLRHTVVQSLLRVACPVPAIQPLVNRFYARTFYGSDQLQYGTTTQCFTFDCLFQQWANEWAIEASKAPEAFRRLQALISEEKMRVHFPVEFRFSPADATAVSPAHGRPTCWIGIVMYKPYGREAPDRRRYYDAFVKLMTEMGARPHWAKYYDWGSAELEAAYGENWKAFLALRQEMDSKGIFVNEWFRHLLSDKRQLSTVCWIPKGKPHNLSYLESP